MSDKINDNQPPAPEIDWSKFNEDQHNDVESFFNLRNWLQSLLEEHGCVITDAGIGFGAADLGFIMNGAQFSISIKPRMKK